MKRIYLFLAMLFVSIIMAQAQDVILTKDVKRIEAKVLSLTKSEVLYRMYDEREDGEVLSERIENLHCILYENGEVEMFDNNVKNKSTESNVYVSPKFEMVDNNMFVNEKGKIYNKDQYVSFLYQNCNEAYKTWQKGVRLRSAGWTLLSVGAALDIMSYVMSECGLVNNGVYACAIVGLACEISCIPTLIVGYRQRGKSVRMYNATCAKREAVALNFGITSNGFGAVISF